MKDQRLNFKRLFSLGFLSFFWVGFIPKAPGTFGSLATIPLILILHYYSLSFSSILLFTFLLFLLSCFIADLVQKKEKVHDPGWIVIDEVIGMLVTWLFIFPNVKPLQLFWVFILFRVFDIVKIFPANWCDKNIKNGMGTIIDDVISALYAGIFIYIGNYFNILS